MRRSRTRSAARRPPGRAARGLRAYQGNPRPGSCTDGVAPIRFAQAMATYRPVSHAEVQKKRLRRGIRRLAPVQAIEQRARRQLPLTVLMVALAPVLIIVFADLVLGRKLDTSCSNHQVSCGLAENGIITLIAAAAAYYLLLGRTHLRVLRSYRERVRDNPATLLPHQAFDLAATRAIRGKACV